MSIVEVKVPDIGDFKDVEVIELLVKPGDTIKADQSLLTVESDKASMEIPSSHAGVVKELKVKLGDKVSEGSLVMLLESSAQTSAVTAPPSPLAATPSAPVVAVAAPVIVPVTVPSAPAVPAPVAIPAAPLTGATVTHASPSIRKFARELGVNLALVTGTGPKGRITHDDVHAFVKSVMSGASGLVFFFGGMIGKNEKVYYSILADTLSGWSCSYFN